MKYISCFLLFYCFTLSLKAQQTTGDNSPLIKGAQAKVNYLLSQKHKLDIPEELVPYLAGILMSNQPNSTRQQMDQALAIWIRKYTELKALIEQTPNSTTRRAALQELRQGNFTAVEGLLKIRTNYKSLVQTFPNTFVTSGNQSPLIIGDYANVTYTVSQVIQYNLPEGVTLNLLKELKAKENQLKKQDTRLTGLQQDLQNKEVLVKKWIAQYKSLEVQLKNSPDAVTRKAYEYYERGDLKGALRELEKASGNDQVMARNRLLKARIMLLQFDYKRLQSQLEAINRNFITSVPLLSTFENNLEYGRFLIDYTGQYLAALPYLQKAMDSAATITQKSTVLNYLSLAYAPVDKLKANEYLEKALALLNEQEPLSDTVLIEQKALVQFNLSFNYLGNGMEPTQVDRALTYIDSARKTTLRAGASLMNAYRQVLFNNASGKLNFLKGNHIQAKAYYEQALADCEKLIPANPNLDVTLSQIYYNMSELQLAGGAPQQSLALVQKSRDIIEPKVNPEARILYLNLEQIYTVIVRHFNPLQQGDSILTYLYRLQEVLQPIKNTDSSFLLAQAGIATDIGSLYLLKAQPDSAFSYLISAYRYYTSNLGTTQLALEKFSNCLLQLNQYYVNTRQYSQAFSYNRQLEGLLNKATALNLQRFQDLLPQVNSQFATVHLHMGNQDSAILYGRSAVIPAEKKVKEYPFVYTSQYNALVAQLFQILMAADQPETADSLVNAYSTVWNSIFSHMETTRSLLGGLTAEHIATMGFVFYQHSQAASHKSRKVLVNLSSKYLDVAEQYYALVPSAPFEQYRKMRFYFQRSQLEREWAVRNENGQGGHHHNLSCQFAKKSRQLLGQIPANPETPMIESQITQLLSVCSK